MALLAAGWILTGCVSPPAPVPVARPVPLTCAQMAGLSIPQASIGLPTGGAQVVSATAVAASGVAPKAFGDYCLVAGEIARSTPPHRRSASSWRCRRSGTTGR